LASYRDLKVWQNSFDLCIDVYRLCDKLPHSEDFGLKSQVKRSSISIPSNIAEAEQRNSRKEFVQFLSIARGSAAELSTQLALIDTIYGLDTSVLVDKTEVIQKMLYKLQNKLLTVDRKL